MQKIICFFILFFSILSDCYAQFFINNKLDCSKVTFYEDNITIGICNLNVYKAVTDEQKICGMLNFNDNTFKKDGMLFEGTRNNIIDTYYFHTEGMKMDIRIMGIVKTNINTYKVYNDDIKYSPPGLKSITIYGNAVFETSEKNYQNSLNKCLLGMK